MSINIRALYVYRLFLLENMTYNNNIIIVDLVIDSLTSSLELPILCTYIIVGLHVHFNIMINYLHSLIMCVCMFKCHKCILEKQWVQKYLI